MDKTGKLHFVDQGVDNMTDLVELSDESLLSNLKSRYSQQLIYTYIGSILISINPYKELGIYQSKHIESYQNKALHNMPPHLFGIGEINYSKMMMENENQVIVISGESGAGKTESFKRLLKYFAHVSGGLKAGKQSGAHSSNDIATKILDSTPLLESFGNAQTIRNDNSSRFGKYVEIFFENGNICGSRITNYLLEKSRIVNISSKERGYHIFYEILQGLDGYYKSLYSFKNVKDYSYLNNSTNFSLKDRNDASNMSDFMGQWSTLGLTNEDMDVTMRILSAVLHLGNIKFMEEQEISYLVETENIGIVAQMLKVDRDSLKHCLTMKTTETVKDATSSPLNVEQSINYRDTLAKHLYSELFNWIVQKVNTALNQNHLLLKRRNSALDSSLNSPNSNLKCIAMLDIYGFENFPDNSLEQLCINYANETLQQFFNRYVFELEQAEYNQEGISWHYITYPDNQPIIDLLSAKPHGIIQILNDECSIPQGSDETFLIKCHNYHVANVNYEKPKMSHPPQFIIHHFAGNISYSVKGFLEKNRDVLRKELLSIIEHCEVEEIASMFQKKREKQTKKHNAKARTPALMGDFQNSLNNLLSKMKTCQPWFIRCLKPNASKEAMLFNNDIVMDQMKYTGILETVKIRKSGFPIRILFSVFLSRFYLLVTKEIRMASQKDQQDACSRLMKKFKGQKGQHFEIGKTKLFLKENFARHLESQVLIIRNRSALTIQRAWRSYWKIRLIEIQHEAATKIQAVVRGFIDRRRINKLRLGILKLQSFVRMQIVRRKFLEEHPEFLKYQRPTSTNGYETIDNSKMTTYKGPNNDKSMKTKKQKNKKVSNQFNYDLLKIPIELAFLVDKATLDFGREFNIPATECIIQTGRAQHLWNRNDFKLPEDIDQYILENYLIDFGNGMPLESKYRPITSPFLSESLSPEFKDNSLTAHKLILRIFYAKSMPWFHRYLTINYLLFMGTKSLALQREILIQIISETIPSKSNTNRNSSSNEEDRIMKAWTLLGNFLSYIIPTPDIYNFVLKYVSNSFGIDQAVVCQEKLLQFSSTLTPQIPRLFPVSNLEHRANQKGAKTCLNVNHPDDKCNSVHLNSFTVAEDLACHSLCFRIQRYKQMKGWSISIVFQDKVYDCGGHNYVFDAIAGLELPRQWVEISGQEVEKTFLTSKRYASPGDVADFPSRGYLKATGTVNKKPVSNKNMSTLDSLKSMDSWVEKVFESSFRLEDTSSIPIQDFIHGLEDELKSKKTVSPQQNPVVGQSVIAPNFNPNLNMQGSINSPYTMDYNMYTHPNPSTLYFPAAPSDIDIQQDPIYLQEQLNTVQLENKVIQSSIEREILHNRLQKIQQQRYLQNANVPHMQFQQQFRPLQNYPNPPIVNSFPVYNHYPQMSYPYQSPNNDQFTNMSYPMVQPNQIMNERDNFQRNQFMNGHQFPENGQLNQSLLTMTDNTDSPSVNPIVPASQSQLQPPGPPPPPPPKDGHENGKGPSESKEKKVQISDLARKKSITKYSKVGRKSSVLVDDNSILPVNVVEDKLSYQRAAEIPKVNVSTRAAFLENFFKDKPMMASKTVIPPKKRIAPNPPEDQTLFPENQTNAINLLASLNNSTNIIPRPSIYSKVKVESSNQEVSPRKPFEIAPRKKRNAPGIKPSETIPIKSDLVPSKRKSLNVKRESLKPEIIKQISFEAELPRINIDSIKTIDNPAVQTQRRRLSRVNLDEIVKPVPKSRKYISATNAIILCGLPDMRYYTYQKTPWYLLLKREVYLPNEINNTTTLNSMIFCQIVRDLIEFPCIRWVGNERKRLLSMLGDFNITKDINSMLAVPGNLMLQVINEVQNCELYFSRFYSIQWTSSGELTGMFYWIAISHSGIRFVQQNSRTAELSIDSMIVYSNVLKISCKDPDDYNNPQSLTITTRLRKKFKMRTPHAASAKSLILQFLNTHEIMQSHGTLTLAGKSKIFSGNVRRKRSVLPEEKIFEDSEPMMLGVNNQRIVFHNMPRTEKPKELVHENKIAVSYEKIKKQGNLIEFVFLNYQNINKKDIENIVLRFQQEGISETILPFGNINASKAALDIFKTLLTISKNSTNESFGNQVENGANVFKALLDNIELQDEVILQIFKQINGNSVLNGRKSLWNLLSIIIIFIGPTSGMQPFLIEHLSQIMKNVTNEDQHLAAYTLKNCKILKDFGRRKEMPLDDEFDKMMNGARETAININIPKDVININISFNATVNDVTSMLCQRIEVQSNTEKAEYALALVELSKTYSAIHVTNYLTPDLYMFDIINSLNKMQCTNKSLNFCRISWVAPLDVVNRSQNFINFHFNQLSKDTLHGEWLLPSNIQINSKTDLSMIAKIAFYSLRGQKLEKASNEDVLKSIFPAKLFDQKKKIISKKELTKLVNSHADNSVTSMIEFQKKYLELIEKLPEYGSLKFQLSRINGINNSGQMHIIFNPTSIFLTEENTPEPIFKVNLAEYMSFTSSIVNAPEAIFTIKIYRSEEIQFYSTNVIDITFMLNLYQTVKTRN